MKEKLVCSIKGHPLAWAAAIVIPLAGILVSKAAAFGLAAIGFVSLAHRRGWTGWIAARPPRRAKPKQTPVPAPQRPRPPRSSGSDLVESMLAQGRHSLLLRPQVVDNLSEEQLRQTIVALQDDMALVPAGHVALTYDALDPPQDAWDDGQQDRALGCTVHVESVFLDRFAVTNKQYYEFVKNGGYEELAIWDEHVLPAMLDFVDRTGHPGPRWWKDGAPPAGRLNHPVVGVCWYEAVAFARWSGKRLPTDAEWTKAACWPVVIGAGNWVQRKYPWGDTFAAEHSNLWVSGHRQTIPVDACGTGISVGGVHQLVGNVWEWMSGAFGHPDDASLALPAPMKGIRGGAFDTFFENQATCQFQSGENPLRRKHNIGFRLALGACDLAPRAAGLILEDAFSPDDDAVLAEVNS
ncbi:MAG: hypothetical protein BMS9Abin04_212 [Planctomycetia bacterium]|nr:MAG: hypothetical protein BMS9Abin04_212 [Planctomycetia bacterium]